MNILTLIFSTSAISLCLQLLSRNIFFAFTSAACMLAVIMLIAFGSTNKRFFVVTSLLINTATIISAIMHHIKINGVIYDYVICAAILLFVSMLSIIEILPERKKSLV